MSRCVSIMGASLAVVGVVFGFHVSSAAEFRIFTVVYDLSAGETGSEKPPVVARAATLFHAGKVYDYVDLANEVIVLEPTERRFRVLNPSRQIVATVAFDEIKQLLNIARDETRRHAATMKGDDPESAKMAALLSFQLEPRFEETFEEKKRLLTLEGGPLAYSVLTVDPQRPGVADEYLTYADWVCQLNYLLHPSPVLPEPRMVLNRALKDRGRLPASVELTCETLPLHLRAEHSIHFDLNGQEEDLIFQWESQLRSNTTRTVPLREYQKTVLTAKSR